MSTVVESTTRSKPPPPAPAPQTGMQGELPTQPTTQPTAQHALPAVPQGIQGDVYGVVPTGVTHWEKSCLHPPTC